MSDPQDWLEIDCRTLFRLHADRRIDRENDPDGSPGPRFWLGRGAHGNLAGVRADVSDSIADELARVAGSEPRFADRIEPVPLERYLALLAPVPRWNLGLVYALPPTPGFDTDARIALIGVTLRIA
ncbi:MAG: hypothetical protein LBJ65_08645 [Burkholderia sp.]|jgi:hypothetical protein|uniref:hypothetical protein n=1 Tax=Burkholderia sp. TaxID=36773 RepID=UPI0028238483|nr:hypothetical protein [Burkholderia sp.]MDR0241654.1 hypothetical protein [Burkholderia sp.]